MTERIGVLLLGHGSRDSRSNREFEEVVASYKEARPHLEVAPAYIELAEPSLADALDAMAAKVNRVVVAPAFLFSAGHVKNDIPLALATARARHPGVTFSSAPALGVHTELAALAGERLEQAMAGGGPGPEKTAVVVVGRGSSDPDANGDFCKMVRLVGEGRGFARVEPTFIGITKPRVEETLDLVGRSRPERIVVLPYFLFAGRLLEKLETMAREFGEKQPWIRIDVAPHLGNHPRLFALLDARIEAALEGKDALPCDTCVYRTETKGFATQVGGLKAMLYSVRHMLTHSQAAPHVHAHRPLDKHVLVCTNTDCADRGSHRVVDALRRELRDAGKLRTIRVTKTSCMGRCGEGPTLVVYPDGVWYRGVKEEDAKALVKDHLLEDRLVPSIVDNIMQ